MTIEPGAPIVPSARPPIYLIAACAVLLVILFLAQSFGPGKEVAQDAATEMSVPMTDVQLAAALYQSQPSITSLDAPMSDILLLTYQGIGASVEKNGSADIAARYILLTQALGQKRGASYKQALANINSATDKRWVRLRPLLRTNLTEWSTADAQAVAASDLGPARLLAAQRVYARLKMPDETSGLERQLREVGSLGSMKVQFWLATLMFMALGGVSAWAAYWAVSSKHVMRPPEPLQHRAGSQPYWEVLAIFLSLHILLTLAIDLASTTIPAFVRMDEDILSIFSYMLTAVITLPLGAARLRKCGLTLKSIGWCSKDWVLDVGWGLGGFFAATSLMMAVSMLVSLALSQFGVPREQNPAVSFFLTKQFGWQTALILMTVSIVAPIVEETFFRGALLKGLWLEKGTAFAVWGTSIAFAAMHPGALTLAVPYIALAYVFGRLTLLRQSLLPSMIAHGLNNLLFAALMMLMQL